jgi:hypothetical protein
MNLVVYGINLTTIEKRRRDGERLAPVGFPDHGSETATRDLEVPSRLCASRQDRRGDGEKEMVGSFPPPSTSYGEDLYPLTSPYKADARNS